MLIAHEQAPLCESARPDRVGENRDSIRELSDRGLFRFPLVTRKARGQAAIAISPPAEGAIKSDARSDSATLLKRVRDVDALACPCGGRLRVTALITEPEVVVASLSALHLPIAPPSIARARAPNYDPRPN